MNLALLIPGFQAHDHDWCIPAFTNLAHEVAKTTELHVFALRYPGIKRSYTIGRVQVHAIGGGAFGPPRAMAAAIATTRTKKRAIG